jgi:hypothetical protein
MDSEQVDLLRKELEELKNDQSLKNIRTQVEAMAGSSNPQQNSILGSFAVQEIEKSQKLQEKIYSRIENLISELESKINESN